jgi:hypothetical protein
MLCQSQAGNRFMTTSTSNTFQGTSKENDFQAALKDAIEKASEGLRGNVADQRIAWQLIETSGSYGGFVGEQTITVTIEAEVN